MAHEDQVVRARLFQHRRRYYRHSDRQRHNYVFPSKSPNLQELIANNGLHGSGATTLADPLRPAPQSNINAVYGPISSTSFWSRLRGR